jgi:hypothetical protein
MVKFGGVDNYIITAWSESDLEACLDLNLPCADASAYLPETTIDDHDGTSVSVSGDDDGGSSGIGVSYNIQDRIDSIRATFTAGLGSRALLKREETSSTIEGSSSFGIPGSKATPQKQKSDVPEFESKAYNRIMWLKPAVVAYLLEQNYAVHSTDVDLAYSSKPVWDSYLMYLNVAPGAQGVDAAFQIEGDGTYGSPINSGNFVALPTPGTKALFSAWLGLASKKIGEGGNQKGLQTLFKEDRYVLCRTSYECQKAVKKRQDFYFRKKVRDTSPGSTKTSSVSESSFPPTIIRTYTPPWWSKKQNFCALSGESRLPELNPCSPAFLYLHPVCTPKGSDRVGLKTRVLDKAGFWFMDSKHGCPVDDGNLGQGKEKRSMSIQNTKDNDDDGNLLVEKIRRQHGRRRIRIATEEKRSETLNTTMISSRSDSEVLQKSTGRPLIEQENDVLVAAAPVSEEEHRTLGGEEEEKEKRDSGFDENEDLSIYSGRGIEALERCIPVEVRRPGTEAKVTNCPLRLAFV